jgi:hypothetical protein
MRDYPLSSIQGNILKSFARENACFLLLRFRDGAHEKRAELSRALKPFVTSAWQQAQITEDWKLHGRTAPVGMFALAYTGYQQLGIANQAPDNEELGADLFRELNAYYPGITPEVLVSPFDRRIDALLLLADNDPEVVDKCVNHAEAELADFRDRSFRVPGPNFSRS